MNYLVSVLSGGKADDDVGISLVVRMEVRGFDVFGPCDRTWAEGVVSFDYGVGMGTSGLERGGYEFGYDMI